MARTNRNFDPIEPLTQRWFYFDFGPELGVGETILSASFTASVVRGTDVDPQSRVQSSPIVYGTEVGAFCGNFLPGVTYSLEANALTSDDNSLVWNSRVYCQSPTDR